MGFVVIDRRLFEGWVWKLPAPQRLVLMYCIYRARWAHDTDQWWDGEKFVRVPRGSFLTSVRKLAEECGVSHRQANQALMVAEADGMVVRRFAERKLTLVTLTKYADYQDIQESSGTQSGSQTEHKRNVVQPSNQETKRERLPSGFEIQVESEIEWFTKFAWRASEVPNTRTLVSALCVIANTKRIRFRELVAKLSAWAVSDPRAAKYKNIAKFYVRNFNKEDRGDKPAPGYDQKGNKLATDNARLKAMTGNLFRGIEGEK